MAHADEIKGKVEKTCKPRCRLPLSYELVTIKTDVDLHGKFAEGLRLPTGKAPDEADWRWNRDRLEFSALGSERPKPASAKATAKICATLDMSKTAALAVEQAA